MISVKQKKLLSQSSVTDDTTGELQLRKCIQIFGLWTPVGSLASDRMGEGTAKDPWNHSYTISNIISFVY